MFSTIEILSKVPDGKDCVGLVGQEMISEQEAFPIEMSLL